MSDQKARRGTGSIFKFKGSDMWWIKYYRDGKPVRESSGSSKITKARAKLQQRLGEISEGTYVDLKEQKITVDVLWDGLLADYRNNDRVSLEGAEQRWKKRLQKKFGGMRAMNVTTAKLNAYVDWCRDEQGLSNGTINRDLAALKRAFNLAWRSTPRRIREVPTFPHLKESAPRSGFVEEAQYRKLKENARELWLRALLATAYSFGFRRSELLDLRVKQIDFLDRTIRLNPGETKNDEGRLIVMTNDVYLLLQACCAGKSADGFVFTRDDNGKQPINDFRTPWGLLCAAADLGKMLCPKCADHLDRDGYCLKCSRTPFHPKYSGLLFHDLRRSAVRNMVRRGIPERVAMQISGHKTRTVFDRYNIVSTGDLIEAARKIEQGQQFGQSLGRVELEAVPEVPFPLKQTMDS